jgi:hypothetical protein
LIDQAVSHKFFNAHHRDPNMPEQFDPSDGLFVFEKRMK